MLCWGVKKRQDKLYSQLVQISRAFYCKWYLTLFLFLLGYPTMEIEFDCGFELDQIIRNAAKKLEAFGEGFDPQIRQADERFGDFQANGVLPHAKAKRQNPRDLAQNLIDSLPKSDFWETSIAGPGFINFKLSEKYFLI